MTGQTFQCAPGGTITFEKHTNKRFGVLSEETDDDELTVQDCVALCRADENCLSINYDLTSPTLGICTLLSEAAGPGELRDVITGSDASYYFKKICVTGNFV